MNTALKMAALVRAAAEDWEARVERNALYAVLPFLRRGFRGELLLAVTPEGGVEASEAPSCWPRDARWCLVEVDDLTARRLLAQCADAGVC